MGKIRIKTLGVEEVEEQQKKEAKKRKEAKKEKKLAKGAHGGERVVSMAPTEEELAQIEVPKEAEVSEVPAAKTPTTRQAQSKRAAKAPRQRSKRYATALIQVDRSRLYPVSEAVGLLKKMGASTFDGTVELHINTTEKGINGQVMLPHGTGKAVRVAIADPTSGSAGLGQFDKLLSDIDQGNITFDILIAHPAAMPKLAKVAKTLGPRGLMPNPKSATISDKPQELAEKFTGGQLHFRTESQAPIIHARVGKVSFREKDLEENIHEFLKAVGTSKIRGVTLKSTMSPGIKIELPTLS